MKPRFALTLFSMAVLLASAPSCQDVEVDNSIEGRRLLPGRGVVRGAVIYSGPGPCSRDGQLVGTLVISAFDRRNLPAPNGTATSPASFTAIPVSDLFANRAPANAPNDGIDLVCPPETETVTASAPFVLSPIASGNYVITAFYDRRGTFLPTLSIRNGPNAGDVVGGSVEITDASATPTFRVVTVGDTTDGYVTDNVTVTVGQVLRTTRPYFYPEGMNGDPPTTPTPSNPAGTSAFVPIVTMMQDHHVLAPPRNVTPATLATYQNSFVSVRLNYGVTPAELSTAVSDDGPFFFQVAPPLQGGGLLVFATGATLPESRSLATVWPAFSATRLLDDPTHTVDPQSIVVRADAPLLTLAGISLRRDLFNETTPALVPVAPGPEALADHITVLVRPAVLCADPRRPDVGGVLVTPHLTGTSADPTESGQKALFEEASFLGPRVREVRQGCLPPGKYAMRLAYPTSQTWAVPNEAGGCALLEGRQTGSSCGLKPRPVIASQGARGVIEILPAADPAFCEDHPVPTECLALP